MERSTFNILFYLNTSKERKDGRCPVMGRITVNGCVAPYSLKADIYPDCWDNALHRAVGKDKTAIELNRKIERDEQSIRKIHAQMLETGYVTAEQIRNRLLGRDAKAENLLQLFREHNDEFEKRIGTDRTASTLKAYHYTCQHLEKFIAAIYGTDDSNDICRP